MDVSIQGSCRRNTALPSHLASQTMLMDGDPQFPKTSLKRKKELQGSECRCSGTRDGCKGACATFGLLFLDQGGRTWLLPSCLPLAVKPALVCRSEEPSAPRDTVPSNMEQLSRLEHLTEDQRCVVHPCLRPSPPPTRTALPTGDLTLFSAPSPLRFIWECSQTAGDRAALQSRGSPVQSTMLSDPPSGRTPPPSLPRTCLRNNDLPSTLQDTQAFQGSTALSCDASDLSALSPQNQPLGLVIASRCRMWFSAQTRSCGSLAFHSPRKKSQARHVFKTREEADRRGLYRNGQ